MVARYNPCGAPVEIGRRSYRTHARLYDDGPLFEILWYPARDDVPFRRGPNAINSLEWEVDREGEFMPLGVGEDVNSERVFEFAPVNPLAVGDHQCGTAADFAGDGVFDPEPPYVQYRPDGLPVCCGPFFGGIGGLAIGGAAYIVFPWASRGGLEVGGTATLAYPKVGSGGLTIGGTAYVPYTPIRYGTGGLEVGGTAGVLVPDYIAGTGGIEIGGQAGQTEARQGTGGLVIGGIAIVTDGTCKNAPYLGLNTPPLFEYGPGIFWWDIGVLLEGVTYTAFRYFNGPSSGQPQIYIGVCEGLEYIPLDFPECLYQGQWTMPYTARVYVYTPTDQTISVDRFWEIRMGPSECP